MKTNRRPKRVKKTRRNRRSRRIQRGGGGNFGKLLKARKEQYDDCKRTCDRIVPDPMKIYTKDKPTPNGWYLYSGSVLDYGGNGRGVEMVISNTSNTSNNTIEIGEYSHREYKHYLDILDELPDLTKIYTTTINLVSKKKWKLIYDTIDKVLKWENQDDRKELVPFDIDSPLKIGDKMALSDQLKQNSSPSTTTPPNYDIKGVAKLVERTTAFNNARRAIESPELMSLRDLVKKLEAKEVLLRTEIKDKDDQLRAVRQANQDNP